MVYILLNFGAILAATVAGYAFGAGYYMALAKPWMAATGINERDIKERSGLAAALPYLVAFIAEFWIAAIIVGALILAPEEAGEWTMALGTAFILWIGFVFPTMAVNDRYSLRPWSQTLINGGHWLGVFVIQVVVMQLMGLTPPPSAM
ncbi:DUF1761 domain-containing protein [Parvularcula sp. ZS-1/3]|uniref:DUF1761 domain-containing protein n=1 Tax=Parvularcula mediterranea TaxID=2732508 RepID=A0A7Y3RP43_9PROT|nr:DUF1761 domain-containing protein [Parvularcula mediterranea]NNU17659.1 DUF1761 domain-containing protein [Parvularcula mediterranea]